MGALIDGVPLYEHCRRAARDLLMAMKSKLPGDTQVDVVFYDSYPQRAAPFTLNEDVDEFMRLHHKCFEARGGTELWKAVEMNQGDYMPYDYDFTLCDGAIGYGGHDLQRIANMLGGKNSPKVDLFGIGSAFKDLATSSYYKLMCDLVDQLHPTSRCHCVPCQTEEELASLAAIFESVLSHPVTLVHNETAIAFSFSDNGDVQVMYHDGDLLPQQKELEAFGPHGHKYVVSLSNVKEADAGPDWETRKDDFIAARDAAAEAKVQMLQNHLSERVMKHACLSAAAKGITLSSKGLMRATARAVGKAGNTQSEEAAGRLHDELVTQATIHREKVCANPDFRTKHPWEGLMCEIMMTSPEEDLEPLTNHLLGKCEMAEGEFAIQQNFYHLVWQGGFDREETAAGVATGLLNPMRGLKQSKKPFRFWVLGPHVIAAAKAILKSPDGRPLPANATATEFMMALDMAEYSTVKGSVVEKLKRLFEGQAAKYTSMITVTDPSLPAILHTAFGAGKVDAPLNAVLCSGLPGTALSDIERAICGVYLPVMTSDDDSAHMWRFRELIHAHLQYSRKSDIILRDVVRAERENDGIFDFTNLHPFMQHIFADWKDRNRKNFVLAAKYSMPALLELVYHLLHFHGDHYDALHALTGFPDGRDHRTMALGMLALTRASDLQGSKGVAQLCIRLTTDAFVHVVDIAIKNGALKEAALRSGVPYPLPAQVVELENKSHILSKSLSPAEVKEAWHRAGTYDVQEFDPELLYAALKDIVHLHGTKYREGDDAVELANLIGSDTTFKRKHFMKKLARKLNERVNRNEALQASLETILEDYAKKKYKEYERANPSFYAYLLMQMLSDEKTEAKAAKHIRRANIEVKGFLSALSPKYKALLSNFHDLDIPENTEGRVERAAKMFQSAMHVGHEPGAVVNGDRFNQLDRICNGLGVPEGTLKSLRRGSPDGVAKLLFENGEFMGPHDCFRVHCLPDNMAASVLHPVHAAYTQAARDHERLQKFKVLMEKFGCSNSKKKIAQAFPGLCDIELVKTVMASATAKDLWGKALLVHSYTSARLTQYPYDLSKRNTSRVRNVFLLMSQGFSLQDATCGLGMHPRQFEKCSSHIDELFAEGKLYTQLRDLVLRLIFVGQKWVDPVDDGGAKGGAMAAGTCDSDSGDLYSDVGDSSDE